MGYDHGAGSIVLSIALWGMLATVLASYLLASVRELRGRRGWNPWRIASFTLGIGLLAAAVSPPMMAFGHHDPRGHMVQHLLLGMFAPLALVLAAPATLLLRSVPVDAARRAARLLKSRPVHRVSHPFSALALDVGAMYLLYLTPLFAASLTRPWLGAAIHLHFLVAGSLFAWSIAGPDPAPGRPRFRTRLIALFCAIALHSTLAKVMYAYGWPRGTAYDPDLLRDAARLMYYGGDVAELLLAVALFATWYRAAGRRYRRDRGETSVKREVRRDRHAGRRPLTGDV